MSTQSRHSPETIDDAVEAPRTGFQLLCMLSFGDYIIIVNILLKPTETRPQLAPCKPSRLRGYLGKKSLIAIVNKRHILLLALTFKQMLRAIQLFVRLHSYENKKEGKVFQKKIIHMPQNKSYCYCNDPSLSFTCL